MEKRRPHFHQRNQRSALTPLKYHKLQGTITGVDLSLKGKDSGIATIHPRTHRCTIRSRGRIGLLLSDLRREKPSLLVIDAPLSLPEQGKDWRECEKKLQRYGLQPHSFSLPSMRKLARRGRKLERKAKDLLGGTCEVFETFPAGSFKLLGFQKKPRKRKARRKALNKLTSMYDLSLKREDLSPDELDALVCCLAGVSYWSKKFPHTKIETGDCQLLLAGNCSEKT